MLTTKQQQNIERNLQIIILENKAKIVVEINHSPEMYKILLENKNAQRPTEDQTLFILYETLLNSEDFMRQNIGLLSLDTLTEEQKKIVYTNVNEGLGTVIKAIGKGAKGIIKWIADKWHGHAPDRPPGGYRPTWRNPQTGQWHYNPNVRPGLYYPVPAGSTPGVRPDGHWSPYGRFVFPANIPLPNVPPPTEEE